MLNTSYKKISVAIATAILMNGCSSLVNPGDNSEAKTVQVAGSYLEQERQNIADDVGDLAPEEEQVGGIKRVKKLSDVNRELTLELDLAERFKEEQTFQVSVNALPLNEFLHYTLGELLKVSYLIEPSVKANKSPVTLALQEEVSAKQLFKLVIQVLDQNKVNVSLNDDIFYIHPQAQDNAQLNRAFGFGRSLSSIPSVSGEVVQLVPLHFGVSPSLRNTLSRLVDTDISIDQVQGLMTVQGKKESVERTLSLVQLLDSRSVYDKAVALLSFEYIDSTTFIEKSTELLGQEGIKVGSRFVGAGSVNFVPIEHLGQVVVFASSDEIVDRVDYWRRELDKAATGSEQSFYIYHPKYARAADIGKSLAPLLGGSLSSNNKSNSSNASSNNNASNNRNNQTSQNDRNASAVQSIQGENMRLVVDDRSNSLIFYASGKHYQELRPIIKRLDIMPKQVMLEVVIAEVKLTGSFSKGVQFALENDSSTTKTEKVSFSSKEGFSYSLVGFDGNVNVNLNQTNGLVNILSRPTLLVRDGVSANMSVGDDIPTIGSTTSDPINGERETTTIQYRRTGVDITVTPTINAQGTVIMTIEQSNSNTTEGTSAEATGTPAIFERKLSTEVVSGNGQTVLLGGLISETSTKGATSVPVLGDLPVLGHLFRSDSDEKDKTELVVLITPRIVENVEDWNRIRNSFLKGLENIKF